MGKHPRGVLAPVTVSCTAATCGHQFLSRAARHTAVRCPRCGQAVRVKRPRPPGWQRKPPARQQQSKPAPELVCAENHAPAKPAGITPVPAPPAPDLSVGQDDDDGWAYIADADGNLVLADLTPDGRLVPVQLADQQFRAIAPGFCSLYGCISPARYMVNGWPVCEQCRRDLSEATALHPGLTRAFPTYIFQLRF